MGQSPRWPCRVPARENEAPHLFRDGRPRPGARGDDGDAPRVLQPRIGGELDPGARAAPLSAEAAPPPDFRAPVAPSPWHIGTIAARLELTSLCEAIGFFAKTCEADGSAAFAVADTVRLMNVARDLDAHESLLVTLAVKA